VKGAGNLPNHYKGLLTSEIIKDAQNDGTNLLPRKGSTITEQKNLQQFQTT